jgi:DNA polymerase-3 subunit delta'
MRKQVGHAYLFAGPPRTGKRTLAVAFAMALNCESTPSGGGEVTEPCGLCSSCSRIRQGTHPDVVLIDLQSQWAALSQGSGKKTPPPKELRIETIREMQMGLGLMPHSARRKVYIIGDADHMNDEAANCLLKSLEEPPSHSVIILLASDETVVLPTIFSRCIYVPLRSVTRAKIAAYLRDEAGLDAQRAHWVAALSGGRVGSARSMLSNAGILEARAAALGELSLLLGATVTDRLEASARLAKLFTDARPSLYFLLEIWEGWWRDLLVTTAGAADLSQNVDQAATLDTQARRFDPGTALAALALVQSTRLELQENVNPRLALESLTLGLP